MSAHLRFDSPTASSNASMRMPDAARSIGSTEHPLEVHPRSQRALHTLRQGASPRVDATANGAYRQLAWRRPSCPDREHVGCCHEGRDDARDNR
jgi:hypothetical protein